MRSFYYLLVMLSFLLVNQGFSNSNNAENISQYSKLQDNLVSLGLTEDSKMLDESIKLSDSLLQKNPNDALAKMYKGAFLVILARDSYNIFKKKSYVTEGTQIMDSVNVSAYKQDADIYLRLLIIRGVTNANIPASLNRSAIAISDLNQVISSPSFRQISSNSQTEVYVGLSKAYAKQNDTTNSEKFKNRALDTNKELATKLLAGK